MKMDEYYNTKINYVSLNCTTHNYNLFFTQAVFVHHSPYIPYIPYIPICSVRKLIQDVTKFKVVLEIQVLH